MGRPKKPKEDVIEVVDYIEPPKTRARIDAVKPDAPAVPSPETNLLVAEEVATPAIGVELESLLPVGVLVTEDLTDTPVHE